MRSIRVLLGPLPKAVEDAVADEALRQPAVNVVGIADTPSQLLRAAGAVRPDVVVVAAVDGALPGVASHLLDQYPDIRVLAVTQQARTALVYTLRPHIEEVSGATPAELADAIRDICRTSK